MLMYASMAPAAPRGKPWCCLRAGERAFFPRIPVDSMWEVSNVGGVKHTVDRNAKKFLPAVIAVQEMHCNAKNVHLGLPWGAAGAMDGFEPSVACVKLNQMLRRLNIRVVVVGFDFAQGPMTPLQVQIFPSFKDAYSAYQV